MTNVFPVPTFAQLRDQILLNIRNQRPDAWLAEDDDEVVRAHAAAAAIEGAYQHQVWILRQMFPQTASGPYLDMHAQLRAQMVRKAATTAEGTVLATGNDGAVIAAGTLATRNGVSWSVTEETVIGVSGEASVPVLCTQPGIAGNSTAGTRLTWASAPPGVVALVTVEVLGGGTEAEDDEALRGRLLDSLRSPPGVGRVADYVRWALEVSGVTTAQTFPRRRGVGSVDVAITSGGGLPSPALLDDVHDHIASVMPAHVDLSVFAPEQRAVDVEVDIAFSGITWESAEESVLSVINLYFAGLSPGDAFIRAQLTALLLAIPGIQDAVFVAPTANVIADTGGNIEWLIAGTLAVGEIA